VSDVVIKDAISIMGAHTIYLVAPADNSLGLEILGGPYPAKREAELEKMAGIKSGHLSEKTVVMAKSRIIKLYQPRGLAFLLTLYEQKAKVKVV
jgi:hypothetical protein